MISKVFKTSLVGMIAAAVAAMLGIVVDGIVIGHFLGPRAMAAYGLATPLVNLANIFSGVLATGGQIICAQRLGAGDAKGARRAFSVCLLAAVVISAVLTSAIFIFRSPIAVLLGAQGSAADLLPLVTDYIAGMIFSLPSLLFLFIFNALMRLDGDAGRVMVAVTVMTVLDVAGDFLNALVIKGGMLGMGLATTISYFVALVILLLHFAKKDIIFKPTLRFLRLRDLRDILATGSSSAVGSLASMLRNAVINRILVATALSGTAVGAFGILNTVYGFTSSTMIGVGLTASMIAGMALGERDRSAAESLVKITVKSSLVLGVGLGAVLFGLAGFIAGAFGNAESTEMVTLAADGLRIYAFSLALYGINNAFVNYMQGMRRMGYAIVFCFLQNFVCVVIPVFILRGVPEMKGIWAALVIAEVLTLLLICAAAAVRKRGLPYRAKDFLFLKEPFGAPQSDVFEVSISDADRVIPASMEVAEFCRQKGASPKQLALLPLFVEELGNNTVRFGFEAGKGQGIDVRVVRTEDGWALRLRDNGRVFDPVKWLELHRGDDPAANIGIRMVCGMAKDISYINTLNLNIITLSI